MFDCEYLLSDNNKCIQRLEVTFEYEHDGTCCLITVSRNGELIAQEMIDDMSARALLTICKRHGVDYELSVLH